jgi:tight adherence protein B
MNQNVQLMVTGVSIAVAIAIALLTWAAVDIGTNGLERYRRLFTEKTRFSMRELFLFVEPDKLFMLNLALMLLMGAIAWVLSHSLFLAAVATVVTALAPRFLLKFLRRRRLDKLEQQLPDTLLMLAGGMKAGVSLTQAVQQLVLESQPPVSQEFDLVLREQRLGVSLDEALDNLNRRVPLQSITLTVSAMRIAAETGGQLAETLERASQTLRSKLAMEGKIRALTSQGKLQAIVVGALPLFLMYVLNKMEPAAMNLMFTTQTGYATLVVIALLEIFGVVIIRKIVDIDV